MEKKNALIIQSEQEKQGEIDETKSNLCAHSRRECTRICVKGHNSHSDSWISLLLLILWVLYWYRYLFKRDSFCFGGTPYLESTSDCVFPFCFLFLIWVILWEKVSGFFFVFFFESVFPQQKPFSCVVPQKNSQSAIHSARWKHKKKRKRKKWERKHEHLGKLWRLLISSLLHIPLKTSHKLSGYWLTF